MTRLIRPLLFVMLGLATAPVGAAVLPWFDDRGSILPVPASWGARFATLTLDIPRSDSEFPERMGLTDPGQRLRLSGSLDPMMARLHGASEEPASPPRWRTLNVSWQHRFEGDHALTFSAGYAGASAWSVPSAELVDKRAGVAITSGWGGVYHPRLTGQLFVGGEVATQEAYRNLGRRYYGLAVGGELTLTDAHTPYVSFAMQRAVHGRDDVWALADDERTQIAAGWKWQARPYLSLQAEASFGYNGLKPRWQNPEQTRLFFGTRYDFQ